VKYLITKVRSLALSIIYFEKLRLIYKYLYLNCYLPYIIRQKAFFLLDQLLLCTVYIRLRNRCFIVSRSTYFFKHFAVSRFIFKRSIENSIFPGIRGFSK
jgi:ribosomal protein S14